MKSSIPTIFWFSNKRKIIQVLFLLMIISNIIYAQNIPEYKINNEKTADGFAYRVITPTNLSSEKSTPVFYLFSFELEGKDLEVEYLKIINTSKFVLVVIEGLKDLVGIGQLRQLYLDISSSTRNNYLVHPARNYLTGNLEGGVIAMAVAKWVEKEIKGVLLFDGFHQPIQGHPKLNCFIYSFAKKDSKELRGLNQLKSKYEEFNKDFTIVEYDNRTGLPESKLIIKAIEIINEKWIRFNDDLIPLNLLHRQQLSAQELKNIESIFGLKKYEEAFEGIEIFIKDFSNTSDKKILRNLEKAQQIKIVCSKEVPVQALIQFRLIMTEYNMRDKSYKNLLETIEKLKGIVENFSLTNSAKLSGIEIEKIQKMIFSHKLNIESKKAILVVAEFMKFVEESNISEESKSIIKKEFKKAELANDYSELILNCLVLMDKDYAKGVIAFGSDKIKTAEKYFDKIQPEKNLFLKAYQLYYLARTSVILDNYERAEEILNDFLKSNLNYTTHQADAFFLLAVCYYNQFKRESALALLSDFEVRFPDAPERMIIGAYQLIHKIESFEEGSMSDVEERMEYSRRKLKMEDIDKPAENNQEKVVALLDKLIKEAEQNEQNQRNKDKNKNQSEKSGKNPDSPKEESDAPEGESKIGNLKKINRGNRDDEWGKERDKEREKIMNALKEKFPERYRELIEQYYKGLHKNEE